jgi:type II restriction enzyme
MNLQLPIHLAEDYASGSQRVRVMTEHWVNQSIFCPNCGSGLSNFPDNRPVADFYCSRCSEEYELKATSGAVGKRIVDGAYSTMIDRLSSSNNPNFFFLTYDKTSFGVQNFVTIPKYFFVPSIIEKRAPLRPTARRAGWIGCNIILHDIPDFGKIFYVKDGRAKSRADVLGAWNRTDFVRSSHDIEAKGWLLDVLTCIERIQKTDFSLDEVYGFEPYLKGRHPSNNNVRAKIRQQLQFLRDKDVIDFGGHGTYRMKIGPR